ncbi:proteasome accessory factor PafA2 family protein, partial [uncultured Bifidobacterium sp.]|uniref:proteasome accessory factor PafA2 family protein n=1 Tax=uncultured Bifidobacterium sp. TaxID=165187 RepID=UPI0028DB39A7
MPQLHDSGSRSGAHASRSPWYEGFARIFGIETEYGVGVTGTDGDADPGSVALEMFRPVVTRARSTNTYLSNGARLYLDVGSHPEYATAEARDPVTAMEQDAAGERIMRRLALGAQRRLRASPGGDATTVHLFKNNADAAGHSFGCHENYLLRRFVSLEAVERELLPFLVTRQLFSGAGRLTVHGFELSQRADFLDEAVSSATTRSRPMVNTRDEPHADPDEFRRLHVIIGDSNRSSFVTWLKLASTHLVLCVIEQSRREGRSSALESCALADPGAANRAVSRYPDGFTARLSLADPDAFGAEGRVLHGENGSDGGYGDGRDTVTALDVQRRYLAVVSRFLESHGEQVDSALPSTTAHRVVEEWTAMLDALDAGDVDAVADRVDWAAKRRLFDALRVRAGLPDGALRARLEQLDFDYHDVANGVVFPSLLRHGVVRAETDDAAIERMTTHPPTDTRAALRGAFVTAASNSGRRWSCDWTRLTIMGEGRQEIQLLDPFDPRPTPEYEA